MSDERKRALLEQLCRVADECNILVGSGDAVEEYYNFFDILEAVFRIAETALGDGEFSYEEDSDGRIDRIVCGDLTAELDRGTRRLRICGEASHE